MDPCSRSLITFVLFNCGLNVGGPKGTVRLVPDPSAFDLKPYGVGSEIVDWILCARIGVWQSSFVTVVIMATPSREGRSTPLKKPAMASFHLGVATLTTAGDVGSTTTPQTTPRSAVAGRCRRRADVLFGEPFLLPSNLRGPAERELH